MIHFPGYTIESQIYRRNRRVLFSAVRNADGLPVTIKTHYADAAAAADRVRLRYEFSLLKGFKGFGIPAMIDLETSQSHLAVIMESIHGESLHEIMGKDLDSKFWVKISIAIAKALGGLHQNHFIHKDIQPENIFIDKEANQIWIIDCRFATRLPKEKPVIMNPAIMEGTLAYMSPEQTGRMNRPLDYRTDFYALGALMYQMLTGHQPFEHPDPLELVYSHLARQPVPPHVIDPDVPEPLSQIVLKLLAKNAEERYLGERGLIEDLNICLQQLEKNGRIESFVIGTEDLPERFQISQKIYGREAEIRMLMEMFNRSSRGGPIEMAVVSGRPGIGKTSLVQEIFKPITETRGVFITGKFDPFHRNVPYNALVHAFQGLVGQLLTENEKRLSEWREKLRSALGAYGQIIIDVIPEMELVIGPQPIVKKLDLVESQNRFNRVFMEFIRVLAAPGHPLVIFLDDLQWVDAATLKLIEVMMAGGLECLFLIVSYRDNEVDAGHPLQLALTYLETEKYRLSHIALKPLKIHDINALLADTLHAGRQSVGPLAEQVLHKTGGNPFFINQFLTLLYHEDLLSFNSDRGAWEWSLFGIQSLDITENVLELLLRRLEFMPSDTRNIMMMAACIGSNFDVGTLVTITDYTAAEVISHLFPAIQEDLVVTISKNPGWDNEVINQQASTTFKFSHDRVRQASYSLIAVENRKPIHLSIGRTMLDNLDPRQRPEDVFDVIHHLNMAADLLNDRTELDEIAELNLIAGNKAKSLAAFEPAYTYYATGIAILGPRWQERYNLALRLHAECAEAARLSGNRSEVERLFKIVTTHARSVLDQVDVYQSRIQLLISENRRLDALAMAQEILREIGMALPVDPTWADAQSILDETIALFVNRNIDHLVNLPIMRDPHHLAAMKIMGAIVGPSYQVSPHWFIILSCEQIKFSVQHGNISNSALAYCTFGLILCDYVGDIEMGHRFGEVALEILRQFDARELEAKVYMAFYAMIHHWKFHLRDTLESLLAGYNSGLETGDFEFGSYNALCYGFQSFFSGKPLEENEQELARFAESCRQIRQGPSVIYNSIFHQTVLNLVTQKDNPAQLTGEAYDERTMLAQHEESGDTTAIFFMHACKIMLCYLFGDYETAVRHADMANAVAASVPGFFITAIYHFYASLSRIAQYPSLPPKTKKSALAKIETGILLFEKWIAHAPMNHAHKYHLLKAEMARVKGRPSEASENYDLSIKYARQNGFINEEALAHELAARHWMDLNQLEIAGIFMQMAYACYASWGAAGKIDHLHQTYPHLFASVPVTDGNRFWGDHKNTGWAQDGLDLATLMKSAQAISGEIVLENLLCTMMKIVIENAGAERGMLILNFDGELRLAAEGTSDSQHIRVLSHDTAMPDSDKWFQSIIHYAFRTQEHVVLKNALEDLRFSQDLYVRTHRPKSVLCIPILYKGHLTGIIYLENRLAPDVFSPRQIEMLKLLTAQIAVSIENTILFEEQKKAEAQYRSIFENAVEGIFLSTPDGRFVSANPAMAQILGYESPEELCIIVTDIENQLYSKAGDRKKYLRLLRKNETVKDFETRFRKKNGEAIWVSLNARSMFNEDRELHMIEGFIIDISQRKAATEALQQREENLRRENVLLRSNIKDRYRFGHIIGKSAPMQEVYELILKAAATDAPVIIYGESGTGKELVAKAIHDTSNRKGDNFVPVNCGAFPETLLESEFFGYKKGAFTGANQDKEGFLDQARDGVLFLDELGEIGLNFQVKLLRALEDGTYTPLGSNQLKHSNARVIAATNRDLQEAILKGEMRKDFYYRIHIIPIYLPPLRKRREDIPLLIEHFINTHRQGRETPPITGEIIEAMLSYDWPGNVRELQNVLHRYCTLGKIDFMPAATLPVETAKIPDRPKYEDDGLQNHQGFMDDIEKNRIINALQQHQWNRKKAAAYLGIPLRSFYRKLKEFGITS